MAALNQMKTIPTTMPNPQSPTPLVSPALSREQWETPLIQEDVVSRYEEIAYRLNTTEAPDLHGIAALALHGQTYGFSWEDVALLRHLGGLTEMMCVRMRGDMSNLADRIAALLPPQDTTGASE